uniref:Uncharacterized protein n=1 Tax=Anguilla anguilla TaxID=7936 RepID=A0A0E9TPV8_ANGAN
MQHHRQAAQGHYSILCIYCQSMHLRIDTTFIEKVKLCGFPLRIQCFSHLPLFRNTIYQEAAAVESASGFANLFASASGACWWSRSCLG